MQSLHRCALTIIVVAGCLMDATAARAEDEIWTITNKTETRHVRLSPEGGATLLAFDCPLTAAGELKYEGLHTQTLWSENIINLVALPDSPDVLYDTLSVITRCYRLNLEITWPAAGQHAHTTIHIKHTSELEMYGSMVEAKSTAKRYEDALARTRGRNESLSKQLGKLQKEVAGQQGKIDELQRKNDELTTQNGELTAKNQELAARVEQVTEQANATVQNERAAIDERVQQGIEAAANEAVLRERKVIKLHDSTPPGERITIRATNLIKQGSRWLLQFEAESHMDEAFPVDELRVWDTRTERDHTGLWRLRAPEVIKNGKPVRMIEPGKRVKGHVQLTKPELLGTSVSMMMSSMDPKFRPPVIRNGIEIIDLTPPPDENEGMMTVSVQGIYGAIWMTEGGVTPVKLDATSLAGLGARLTYGLTRRLNLDIDAVFARTGDARFEDITYQGMTGELVRSAWLGRVQGSLMARFGESESWYRPTLRAGVGMQGLSSETGFEVNSTPMPGPEVPFDFDFPIWSLGGGLDLRLGPFTAGLMVNAAFKGEERSIEANGSLGYRWK